MENIFMNKRSFLILMISFFLALVLSFCAKEKNETDLVVTPSLDYSLTLIMTRVDQAGLDPFTVTATLKKDGINFSGQTLSLSVPKGSLSAITDNNDGTYSFTVTPSSTGEYPVTISYQGVSIKRTAVVFNSTHSGVGQPMAIPGEYVNTEGYEDGITITPDGEYLFVQYGPIHFSGVYAFATICSDGAYTSGYNLNGCDGRADSSLVFDSIGPYGNFQRPNFPSGGIVGGTLQHLSGIVSVGVFNGITGFPTVFYGFKRQTDGTFAEPFKIAFNDDKGVGGPFGMSFVMNGDGTAKFAFAWNNYFDGDGDGGVATGEDDGFDIYGGTIIFDQDNNLGDVTWSDPAVFGGDLFDTITPNFTPISFPSHAGYQGNPHLYAESGVVKSIWTDDEYVSHNISVYSLTSGTYPSGTWVLDSLPTDVATAEHESMPFFTGSRLFMMRGSRIIYHDYTPSNGVCASTYTHNDCWGSEVIVLNTTGDSGVDEIFNIGEPTIATRDGKTYLYFVYVLRRANTTTTADLNMNAGFVEIP
jgi:invasin-like protein